MESVDLLYYYDFSDRFSEALVQGLVHFGLQVGRRDLDEFECGVAVLKAVSQAAIHILVEHLDPVLGIKCMLCHFERQSELDLDRMHYFVRGKQVFVHLHLPFLFLQLLLHAFLLFLLVSLGHHGSLVLLVLLLYYLLILGLVRLCNFSRREPCV